MYNAECFLSYKKEGKSENAKLNAPKTNRNYVRIWILKLVNDF